MREAKAVLSPLELAEVDSKRLTGILSHILNQSLSDCDMSSLCHSFSRDFACCRLSQESFRVLSVGHCEQESSEGDRMKIMPGREIKQNTARSGTDQVSKNNCKLKEITHPPTLQAEAYLNKRFKYVHRHNSLTFECLSDSASMCT